MTDYVVSNSEDKAITQESVVIEMIQESRGKNKKSNKQSVETTQAMTMPVSFKTDDRSYSLYVMNYGIVIDQASHILIKILPIVLGVIFAISVLTSLIYARLITRPIRAISQTAERMATLDLRCEEESRRTDEIGILSRALNELAAKLSKTLTDLTDSNRHLEEANINLAEVNGQLEEANKRLEDDIERERNLEQKRREFFAAVSHELKTPITIIKGQLEGMIYKVGNYKDRDTYLKKVLGVTNRMEEMVLEILTISRMESTKFKLVREPILLKELVVKSAHEAEELASNKGIKLVMQLQDDSRIEGDKKMLKKVLDNLIQNGITHSPEGSEVRIRIHRQDGRLYLAIENTGVHIEENERPKVFEAFYRVEKSRNRQTGGTGLGLYIVKIILEMHQLTYEMNNTQEGICFEINFTQNTN